MATRKRVATGSSEEASTSEHDTSPPTHPEDLEALLAAAAGGDQVAWDALVDRFAGLLWAIARRHLPSHADAADACQMTWLKLLEHLGSIKDPARLPGWLSTTCQRECLAVLRRSGRTIPVSDEGFLDARAAHTEDTDHAVLLADAYSTLWQAFGRLNERCQRLLRLLIADAEEGPPSYQGAAVTLGMPIGSLGPTRARCLTRLRRLLEPDDTEPG
ncbi:MAG TPA: sigma-70 family RNA polymerase sigma factor [Kineosporiaceae bacterium]|nr:sigma-70 family RNA polymerase sigma factor [Kineosporiaceae bacterium]